MKTKLLSILSVSFIVLCGMSLISTPELPSKDYVLADTVFVFPASLHVEGKIYYQSNAAYYHTTQIAPETRFPVTKVYLACDTSVAFDPRDSSGLSAIKFPSQKGWSVIWGESQFGTDSIERKEYNGAGVKDGYFYYYFAPAEQPYFSLRVKMEKKQQLINEVKKLQQLIHEVGLGQFCKLPKP